jgi:hypothetical protein
LGYARPNTRAATSAAIERIGFEIVAHPPYSLDLAPSDFCLFATLKKQLKGINFKCDEVQAAMENGSKNSLKSSTAMSLKNLLSIGSIV